MYRRVLRRWSSTAAKGGAQTAKTQVHASERRATPGFVRVRKGFEADKHEAELDSTLARVIGSDWGDRSHQPVSLPMRIYWVIFGVVLLNGVYTYFAGKDESFLVEKLKKKADEKMGVEEQQNEFEQMASDEVTNEVKEVEVKVKEEAVAKTAPASMLGSGAAAGVPFFSPVVTSNARRAKTKPELQQQLAQLRLQQERLRKQTSGLSDGPQKEELEHQMRMIDVQKAQLKTTIKSM